MVLVLHFFVGCTSIFLVEDFFTCFLFLFFGLFLFFMLLFSAGGL